MNKAAFGLCLCLAGTASAQPSRPEGGVPKSAFFAGVGASYTFVNFGGQSVYNKGLSNVFQNGSLIANGEADGPPVQASLDSQSNFAPVAQLGYFQHFADSPWMWGAKFSYSYLGTSSTTRNLVIPQFGSSTAQGVSSFTGYSVTGSYSVAINHQTTFMPIVGRSFERSFVYFGAGPSLSQIRANLNDVVGFATINGVLTDISGGPQSFSATNWIFGAAATAGVTYFLTPSWFVDLSYSFTAPNARTLFAISPFDNPGTGNGVSFTGTLIGTYTANVNNTHAIMLTINRAF